MGPTSWPESAVMWISRGSCGWVSSSHIEPYRLVSPVQPASLSPPLHLHTGDASTAPQQSASNNNLCKRCSEMCMLVGWLAGPDRVQVCMWKGPRGGGGGGCSWLRHGGMLVNGWGCGR